MGHKVEAQLLVEVMGAAHLQMEEVLLLAEQDMEFFFNFC